MSFAEQYTQPMNGVSLQEYVLLVNNDQLPSLPHTSGHEYDTSFDSGYDPIDPETAKPGDIVDVRSIASRSVCYKLADGVLLRGTFTLQETNGAVLACAAVVRSPNTTILDHYVTSIVRIPVAYDWAKSKYSDLLQAASKGILQVTADVRLAHDQHETNPEQTTQVAEIATIYAAERPFDGNIDAVPVGGSVVVEGQIVSTANTDGKQAAASPNLTIATSYGQEIVDTTGLSWRQLRQLDPSYAPRPDGPLLRPAEPVLGDIVQVRLYKTLTGGLRVIPGTFLKSNDIEAGVVPTIYVTEANENRQIAVTIRTHRIASEIRRILNERAGTYQRVLGDFLLDHTDPEGGMNLDPTEQAAFDTAVARAVKGGWHPAGANLNDHRLAVRILETTSINPYSLTNKQLERLADSYMRRVDLPKENAGMALLDILRVTEIVAPDTHSNLVVSALNKHGPAAIQSIKETGQITEVDQAVLQFALQSGGATAQTDHDRMQAFLKIAADLAGALPSESQRSYTLLSTIGDTVHTLARSVLAPRRNADIAGTPLDRNTLAKKVLVITALLRKSIHGRTGAVWDMSQSPDRITQLEAAHTPDPQGLMAKIEAIEALLEESEQATRKQ